MRVDIASEGEDIARENWSRHKQNTPPTALTSTMPWRDQFGSAALPVAKVRMDHTDRMAYPALHIYVALEEKELTDDMVRSPMRK